MTNGTLGAAFDITDDVTGDNFNPVSKFGPPGNFYVAWQHFDAGGNPSIGFDVVNINGTPGPVKNLAPGFSPHIAVDGSGNVLVEYLDLGDVINLITSHDHGVSFGSPTTPFGAINTVFTPLVNASGSTVDLAGTTVNSSGIQTVTVAHSADGGVTFGPPFTIHQAPDTNTSFTIPSLGFLGVTDPTLFDAGANTSGSTLGAAFVDFGDAGGSSAFTTVPVGSNFKPPAGCSRSDNVLELGAISLSDSSTHLLQGNPTNAGTFSDLTASTDSAQEVAIACDGTDTNVYILQTINSIPGPIELIRCHH